MFVSESPSTRDGSPVRTGRAVCALRSPASARGSAEAFGLTCEVHEVCAQGLHLMGRRTFGNGCRHVLGGTSNLEDSVDHGGRFLRGEDHRVGGDARALDLVALLVGALPA